MPNEGTIPAKTSRTRDSHEGSIARPAISSDVGDRPLGRASFAVPGCLGPGHEHGHDDVGVAVVADGAEDAGA